VLVGIAYDLAVLQANDAIDRSLKDLESLNFFNAGAENLQTEIRKIIPPALRCLGLSWKKVRFEDVDLAKPSREVEADLRHFLGARVSSPYEVPVPVRETLASRLLTIAPGAIPSQQSFGPDASLDRALATFAIPSQQSVGTPDILLELNFSESEEMLPDGSEGVKSEIRSLAHTAILAVSQDWSTPQSSVDDWIRYVRLNGYSFVSMRELAQASRDHLLNASATTAA